MLSNKGNDILFVIQLSMSLEDTSQFDWCLYTDKHGLLDKGCRLSDFQLNRCPNKKKNNTTNVNKARRQAQGFYWLIVAEGQGP